MIGAFRLRERTVCNVESNLLPPSGAREDDGDDENGEDEMKRRFCTKVCQTPEWHTNKQTDELIHKGVGFGPVTPDTRNGVTRDEMKMK